MSIETNIDEFNKIMEKLSSIKDNTDAKIIGESIDFYGRAFDLLLRDSNNPDNIFNEIKTSKNPSDVQKYVQALKSLNKMVNDLAREHPLKSILQDRLADNVNLSSIEKFEKFFLTHPQKAASEFVTKNQYPHMINTVEVRTWGTEREYSNGLRNVIEQKLRQDDVGHVAVVMRVGADEEGLRLVRQYCINPQGKTIIPYELKKIGDQVVYEIYWSYWPGVLHTQEQDYEHERRGLEYRDIQELDRTVPKELSDKYIIHKLRQGKRIPFAAASERATVDSSQEITSHRGHYLDLKEREIKLKEQIETIDVMLENYLNEGKPYFPSQKSSIHQVKKKSNFYEILSRFKNELQPRSITAKILVNEIISPSDAKKLKSSFEILKKKKNKEIEQCQKDLEEIVPEIQGSYVRLKELENRITSQLVNTSKLGGIEIQRKNQTEVQDLEKALKKLGENGYPIVLSEELISKLGYHIAQFNNPFESTSPSAIDKRSIETQEELERILQEFDEYESQLIQNINTLERDEIRELMKEQVNLFIEGPKHEQEEINRQLQNIEKEVSRLKLQIEELERVIPTITAISPLEAIKEIGLLEKSVKNLDKISKNFKNELDFTYRLNGEDQSIRLTSIQQVLNLSKKLSDIHAARKTELPALREKLKTGEQALEHSKDKKGNPVTLRSAQEGAVLKQDAQNELSDLLIKQKKLQEKLQFSKLKPNTHISEIGQKQIRRGFPYKSSTLRGFNIEEMLKIAKPLSGTVKNFDLKIENCSTTSMKLLHAGSPEFNKPMFVASKPPVIKTAYKFKFKPDHTEFTFKSDTVYFKAIDGKLTYSVLDKKGKKQNDIELGPVPDPLTVESLENYRAQVLEDIGTRGFSDDFEYDGDVFLTNPQAVYAAARVYERMDAGDKQAISVAQKLLNPKTRDTTYNRLINKIALKSEEELAALPKNPLLVLSIFWEFIKRPSTLYILYQDYKNPEQKENIELVAVESQLRDIETAIRELSSSGKYLYINSGTPAVAINQMLIQMNSNPQAIPFFTKEKLNHVDHYIFKLASKDNPTNEDKAILKTYDKIMDERDHRIKVVEKALANGRHIQTQLINSASNSKISDLKFPFTENDLVEHKVDIFIREYTKNRKNQYFTFARSNFVKTLERLKTPNQKLAAILQNIANKPHSRSARVWKQHIETDPILVKMAAENKHRQQTRAKKLSSELFKKNQIVNVLENTIFENLPLQPRSAQFQKENHVSLKRELQQHREKFDAFLKELWDLKIHFSHTNFHFESHINDLHQELSVIGTTFFERGENINEEIFNEFKTSCEARMQKAEKIFKLEEPGVWNDYIKPIFKGIWGVILAIAATLLTLGIIPLVVARNETARNRYVHTFFKRESSQDKQAWHTSHLKPKLFGDNDTKEKGIMGEIEETMNKHSSKF